MKTRKKSQRKREFGMDWLQCNKCEEWKIETEENFQFRKDVGSFRPTCKVCLKIAKANYYKYDVNQEIRKSAELKRVYGISLEEYNEMLNKQNGGCAICRTIEPNGKTGRFKHFSVDHCHSTGKVRGLLCNHCNRGIGMLQDSKKILYNAYNYLKDFDDSSSSSNESTDS